MNRVQKQTVVENLKDILASAKIVIAIQNAGITAGQILKLRKNIRQSNGSTMVAKNTLIKLSLKGSDYEHISDLFQGPTVLVYSNDNPVAMAKIVMNFAKENETLKVLGGAMNLKTLDINMLKVLADLPSLDELRGMLIGIIQAPASKIARLLTTPGEQVTRVLKAYSEK